MTSRDIAGVRVYLGLMEPLSLDTADQFRPHERPALHSKKSAREYNEGKQIGSTTSTTRTAEQTLPLGSGMRPRIDAQSQEHLNWRGPSRDLHLTRLGDLPIEVTCARGYPSATRRLRSRERGPVWDRWTTRSPW
jgi:hypothetical protein